jgi:hypothetical protein
MPTLAEQIRRRAHVYVAHGGKSNRRQQVDRLVIMRKSKSRVAIRLPPRPLAGED